MDINTCNAENTGCVMLNVNLSVNVEDFFRTVVSEGEVMPLIVVDSGGSEEPARIELTTTDFDFSLVPTSTRTKDVQILFHCVVKAMTI